jgi:coenzyme PQQ synthesis protein D (PqqD)
VLKYSNSSRNRNAKNLILPRETFEVKQNSPIARKSSLIVKELPTETLVYDLDTDQAHCLNETAARVWKNCDGQRDVAELRRLLEKETNASVPEEVVWLALDQLEKFKLLDKAPAQSFFSGMNRREVVKRIGISALALPVIISIVAPDAKAQGSLLPPGACCTNGNQCQSGTCNQGGPCNTSPSSKSCG